MKFAKIPLFIALFVTLSSCTKEPDTGTKPASKPEEETAAKPSELPQVVLSTSKGDITIELEEGRAPVTVANFLQYVDSGFFDGTIFHRVISDFMIQGGGFVLDGNGGLGKKETSAPIQNEAKNGLKNARGTISMARTSNPHSATAQFFINRKDNTNLDYPSFDGWGYAVFGRVVDGMDVVDAIAEVPVTVVQGMENVPVDPVVIVSAKRK